MKKHSAFLLFFLSIFYGSFAQQQVAPSIQWQKCLGGTQSEYNGKIVRATDGGYLVVSESTSRDGDVMTHPNPTLGFSQTIFIVKFSNTGALEWQRCIGVATGTQALDLKNTPDGGYIIATLTFGNDPSFTGYHAQADALIIKLRSDGTSEWQKCFGGSLFDLASAISVLDDGYIFLGQSTSNDGDVPSNRGGYDIWVVKIDKQGNLIWKKTLGGSADDFTSLTSFSTGGSIIQTSDNGIMLTAVTMSTNGDVVGHKPFLSSSQRDDVWVVKLDSLGNKLWQKCFGGSGNDKGNDIIQLSDGNFILLAQARSNDEDVVNYHANSLGFNEGDFWVLKLTPDGNIIWQKSLGGKGVELPYCIKTLPDGNFLIAGSTGSNDGDIIGGRPNQFGAIDDAWLVKTNNSGEIIWQKTFGGSNSEGISDFCITEDGEIVFTGYTSSVNDGDIVGSHNANYTVTDIWVVKTGDLNTIKGTVFIDFNANGVKDASDVWAKNILVKSEKPGYSWQTQVNNGTFINKVDAGTFTTGITLAKSYFTIVPSTKQSTFTTYLNTDSVNFSLVPNEGKKDVRITVIPITPARAGFYASYKLVYENVGTVPLSNFTVQLIKDTRSYFQYSAPGTSTISGDTLKWNIQNLAPTDSGIINFTVLYSSSGLRFNNFVYLKAAIDSLNDLEPSDNSYILNQRVTGSYDPNDKQEGNGGSVAPEKIATGNMLTYTIRFQNTGNDTAFNITVKDTLEAGTDWNTVEMVNASHPYQFSIKNNNELRWIFSNIKLVDSFKNEALSHGYITYRIKPSPTLVIGDSIRNNASIYFDFNDPIKTNLHVTNVKSKLLPTPVINNIATSYCIKQGVQKIKVANLPQDDGEMTVLVKLDETVLPVSADSTFSFTPSDMTEGNHQLSISYNNGHDSKMTMLNFKISPAVSPDVNINSNTVNIVNLTSSVILTASNISGGGLSPLFTFAKDKQFTNILQAEGNSNSLTISPENFIIGDNWVYVQMRTSESCYSSQTNIDSINIKRSAVTGLVDLDFPGQQINIYPNPFKQGIYLNGLNSGKKYHMVVSNVNGQVLFSKKIANAVSFHLQYIDLPTGTYWLSLFDERKKKLIGTVPLIKE